MATFDYSYLVFAAIWDYLVFSTAPSATTTLGILLIVAAGLLVMRRADHHGDAAGFQGLE